MRQSPERLSATPESLTMDLTQFCMTKNLSCPRASPTADHFSDTTHSTEGSTEGSRRSRETHSTEDSRELQEADSTALQEADSTATDDESTDDEDNENSDNEDSTVRAEVISRDQGSPPRSATLSYALMALRRDRDILHGFGQP